MQKRQTRQTDSLFCCLVLFQFIISTSISCGTSEAFSKGEQDSQNHDQCRNDHMPEQPCLILFLSITKIGNVGITENEIIRGVPSLILFPIEGSWIGIFFDNGLIIVTGSIVNGITVSIDIFGRHRWWGQLWYPSLANPSQEIPFGKCTSSVSFVCYTVFDVNNRKSSRNSAKCENPCKYSEWTRQLV